MWREFFVISFAKGICVFVFCFVSLTRAKEFNRTDASLQHFIARHIVHEHLDVSNETPLLSHRVQKQVCVVVFSCVFVVSMWAGH